VKKRILQHLHRFLNPPRRRERGQSMVELALAFPILLLVLAGTLEVGKYFNDYITILDATREGARYSADGEITVRSMTALQADCNADKNFFHLAACLARDNIKKNLAFNDATDDVVVSAMSIDTNGHIITRFPRACSDPPPPAQLIGTYLYGECDPNVTSSQQGWSLCQQVTTPLLNGTCSVKTSLFSNAAIEALLAQTPNSPATGLVVVEVYREHNQFLGLIPPGLAFLPQKVMMHAYSMMPVPAAAPPPSYTP
jgi:hypothetical protein